MSTRSDRFGYKPKASDVSDTVLFAQTEKGKKELEDLAKKKKLDVDFDKMQITKSDKSVGKIEKLKIDKAYYLVDCEEW